MSTTLSPDFLTAALLVTNFKGKKMMSVQAALLTMGLSGQDFTAAQIPSELVGDSKNISGCASGSLVAQGLITVVSRMPSPKLNAKGRKLDVFRIADGKRETAKAWLRVNGFQQVEARQEEFAM